MAYKLKDIKDINDFNYNREVEAILKLLTTWDIKAAPKGYAEFMKNYQDYSGMDEIQDKEEALLKSFNGHGDGTVGSDCLVMNLTKEYVGYNDRNQMNGGPLEALISALLTHGIVLGMRLCEIDKKSEPYRRINQIKHAFYMGDFGGEVDDAEMSRLYRKEFEALINLEDPRSLREINNDFENVRRQLKRARFLQSLVEKFKETSSFMVYSSNNKTIHDLWGYIHGERGSEKRYEAFIEDMKKIGVTIHRDKDVFHISQA